MNGEAIAAKNRLLPVLTVAKLCYGYAWENRYRFALPVFVLAFFYAIYAALNLWILLPVISHAPSPAVAKLIIFGWNIPILIGSFAFEVGMHRTILLNDFRNGMAFFRWGRDLGHYLLTFIKIVLYGILVGTVLMIVLILGVVLGLQPTPSKVVGFVFLVIFAWLLVLFALSLRFALAFPAAAIGEEGSLSLSWQLTKRNWLRFLALGFIVVFPMALANFLLAIPLFFSLFALTPLAIGLRLINAAVGVAITALTAIMLSFAYKELQQS